MSRSACVRNPRPDRRKSSANSETARSASCPPAFWNSRPARPYGHSDQRPQPTLAVGLVLAEGPHLLELAPCADARFSPRLRDDPRADASEAYGPLAEVLEACRGGFSGLQIGSRMAACNPESLRSQIVTSKAGRGGRQRAPYTFTTYAKCTLPGSEQDSSYYRPFLSTYNIISA